MRERLMALEPEDEASAQGLQAIAGLSPLLVRMLPTDSEEIDRYLRFIAAGAAFCRSDGAPALAVFEAHEGEWRKVEL